MIKNNLMTNKNKSITIMVLGAIIIVISLFGFIKYSIQPKTMIQNDVKATQNLFETIDSQMTLNDQSIYMATDPSGYVSELITVIRTVSSIKPTFGNLQSDSINYYDEYNDDTDSNISVRYMLNFAQSKVDNIYIIRKIKSENLFDYNAHNAFSLILFNLNKQHNIKPATSLRLELSPIKMKNGDAYHYFAKESDITKPVVYDACKETLDCLYISRYHSTIPR